MRYGYPSDADVNKMYDQRKPAAEHMAATIQRQIGELQMEAYKLGLDVHYRDYNLVNTIQENVDNVFLSDAEFREFVRNSVAGRKEQ